MEKTCENCDKKEAKYQTCHADGRNHWHGAVHVPDKGLMALCDECDKKLNPVRVHIDENDNIYI